MSRMSQDKSQQQQLSSAQEQLSQQQQLSTAQDQQLSQQQPVFPEQPQAVIPQEPPQQQPAASEYVIPTSDQSQQQQLLSEEQQLSTTGFVPSRKPSMIPIGGDQQLLDNQMYQQQPEMGKENKDC